MIMESQGKGINLQRNEFLWQCYMEEVSVHSGPEMLILLDETGADCRNTIRIQYVSQTTS